jgi:hypothetical protein
VLSFCYGAVISVVFVMIFRSVYQSFPAIETFDLQLNSHLTHLPDVTYYNLT